MRNLGRASVVRIGYQADAATPATTDFFDVPFYEFRAPPDADLIDDPLLGGAFQNGRDPAEGVPALPGGDLRLVTPLDLNMLPHFLKMALGTGVASGASPNFVHTFQSGRETLPYVTIQARFASGDVGRFIGCMLNTLNISVRKEAGYARLEMGFLHRVTAWETDFIAGSSAAALAAQKILQYRGTARWGGVNFGDLLELSLAYSNNLERYNTVSGDEWPVEIDPGFTQLSGSMRLRLRNRTMRQASAAKTTHGIELAFAHPSDAVNRLCTFTLPTSRVSSTGVGITGPGGIDESFNFRSEQTLALAAMAAVARNGTASTVYGYT